MASIYHLLNRQIPAHIREQYPVFCKFIEYYYRWLQTRGFDKLEKVTNIDYECQAIALKDCYNKNDQLIPNEQFASQFVGYTIVNDSGVVAEIIGFDQSKIIIRYLTMDGVFNMNDQLFIRQNTTFKIDDARKYDRATISQIQTLPSAYIDHFAELLDSDHIFDTNNANIALILKHVKQLYQSKGSEQALKYILKATQNIDADINYPWKQVLKPSDGRWRRQFAVNIKVDKTTWTHIPTNFDRVLCEIKSTDPLHPEPTYVERNIVKLELFGRQTQNYDVDDEGGWWRRDNDNEDDGELDYERIVRDEHGNIIFYGDEFNHSTYYPKTYGEYEIYEREVIERDQDGQPIKDAQGNYIPVYLMEYLKDENGDHILDEDGNFIPVVVYNEDGSKAILTERINDDRLITPYIRLYFEDDPEVYTNQYIKVVGLIQKDDGSFYEKVVLDGYVTLGVKGFDIKNPGSKWQVGQIFTADKDTLWQLYNEPTKHVDEQGFEYSNSITTNERGVIIQYSTDVPLIGRVTAIGPRGEIQSAEIIQLGDHLPQNAGKRIIVSPVFNPTIDPTPYQAEIELAYGNQTSVMGYFDDNSGMLSDNEIRLQDNFYYQKFSYDIIANADPNTYIDMATKMHPAGAKMFTTYVLESDLDNTNTMDAIASNAILSISLFDVAIVADKLAKTTIKRLSDETIIKDLVMLTTIKVVKDNVLINDSLRDRVYVYEYNQGYDVYGDQSYIERTYSDLNVNTSYSAVGYEKRVYVNYEYQTIPDQYKR